MLTNKTKMKFAYAFPLSSYFFIHDFSTSKFCRVKWWIMCTKFPTSLQPVPFTGIFLLNFCSYFLIYVDNI